MNSRAWWLIPAERKDMGYQDFIDYVNREFDREETYETLESVIIQGINWCDAGRYNGKGGYVLNARHDGIGSDTILCAYCKYYQGCDALHYELEERFHIN